VAYVDETGAPTGNADGNNPTGKRGWQQGRLKVRHKAAGAAMLVPVLSGLLPSVGRPRCQC
jgi:hypothetical protein